MYLNRDQERMLNGEYGEAYARALRVIVKVGESLGAEKLVSIKHAHVSGVSYSNIGGPGLDFIRDFYREGVRVRVYSTINPGCIDLSGASRIISDVFRDKQLEINKYLEEMGFKPTYTCIPYIYRAPSIDEHLAWGESSAVVFANSVFGARTNREGGPLAFASALTGYTYYWGLHLLENRRVSVEVSANNIPLDQYGALGLWIGEHVKETPLIKNIVPDLSSVKLLLAASAASGAHGLVVLENITPINTYVVDERVEKISVEKKDLEEYVGTEPSREESILGYIGCPHLDPWEFKQLLYMVEKVECSGKRGELLVSVPHIYFKAYREEVELLRHRGVDIVAGTCPIVSHLAKRYDRVITNSGKAVFYMSRLHGLKTHITSLDKIIKYIYGG